VTEIALLSTKLFVPRPPVDCVRRERLFELLDAAEGLPLTLVAAPAGFGKSVLVAGWARERAEALAWLSLDRADDSSARFWSYVVAALQTIDEGLGRSAQQILRSPQPPDDEAVVTTLVNDLAELSDPVVLVLDDYHLITSQRIHEGLLLLLEHMPPGARVVVTTRADPPWPLAQLRASGRMAELRSADLRFTDQEAVLLLESVGLELGMEEVRMLESRTEGWVAGLQMAALSMRGRAETTAFIRAFAGDHRFVFDYLAEEVLTHLTEHTRRFLVQTSILERLEGDLCDAVTGGEGGQKDLERLEQMNVFTDSLDDERRWFRYHQLFADILRSRLPETDVPEAELHRRASEWFEAREFEAEAIHHALEAGEVDRAARLIGGAASVSFMVGDQVLVLDWLRRLPSGAIASRPELALIDAWARFVTGDWEGMRPAVELAAEAIEAAPSGPEKEGMQGQLDGIRSWIAYQTGDLAACVELAEGALPRMPDDGLVPSRIVAAALGYGLLLEGRPGRAEVIGAETTAESRSAGDALTEALAIALEGQVRLLEGRLESAADAYQRATVAGTVGGQPLPPVAIAQVQLAEVQRERNELERCADTLERAIAACEQAMGMPEWVFEGSITMARALAAQGEEERSREIAERAEEILERELLPGGMEPIIRRSLAYRVRYWLGVGRSGQAARWLGRHGIAADDDLDPSKRALHVVLARTLLEVDQAQRAVALADRLLALEVESSAPSLVIELQVVRALALQEAGSDAAAAEALSRAVSAGKRHGHVRVFVDEGERIARLLGRVDGAGPDAEYVSMLRRTLDAEASRGRGDLLEELNDRELALLRMFAAGRSNGEIAEELFLSVNTVKWHARRLYAKLDVHRRGEAVARARELKII